VVLGLEVVGKGDTLAVGLCLAHGLEFFAALGDQLVFILWGWRGWGIGVRVGHVGRVVGLRARGGFEPGLREKKECCAKAQNQLF
jgi:hypothetical protein